ncbi:hypothetical protein ACFPZ0_13960 [Streptomonospora nanhaiensis]|uniref:hypothetical protein n=1 Tax=Streptomonospora nanhaiensis TaxID=1323731 RepID=UPI001C98F6E0|nr:hypothetical protein [Streptomonospora nanhaiensis]MBX9389435.1 hypothetical protein [Streptomonospora nanhaiensis]
MAVGEGLGERFERLYSLAARMLWAQGEPAWRGSGWPAERARAWRDLERVLAEDPGSDVGPPGPAPDPARHLLSRWAADGGRPLGFAAAVGAWEERLDADPGTLVVRDTAPSGTAVAPDRAVVLADRWYSTVRDLLDELAHRLAPGRPVAGLSPEAAPLSARLHELADALRRPVTGTPATPHPAEAMPAPAPSRPLAERPDLPAAYERLRGAARRAAKSVTGGMDLSLAPEVPAAARDVLRAAAEEPVPEWRERHEGIDPARHMAYGYRWTDTGGGPLGFAQRAAEITADLADTPAPAAPEDYLPPPEEVPDRDWTVLSHAGALVRADLLDELAARLHPAMAPPHRLHAASHTVVTLLTSRLKGASDGR